MRGMSLLSGRRLSRQLAVGVLPLLTRRPFLIERRHPPSFNRTGFRHSSLIGVMGNLASSLTSVGSANYVAHVKTGDRKGAGTDSNVFLILHDDRGNVTKETKLSTFLKNDHERGDKRSYAVSHQLATAAPRAGGDTGGGLGRIVKIEFWRDNFGLGGAWNVDLIEVEDRVNERVHSFPVHRWIKPNVHYVVQEYDSCLPQFEIHADQRREELKEKRDQYQYILNVPNGPAQVKQLPEDETFSDSYKWDIVGQKVKLLAHSTLIKMHVEGRWESLEDLKNVYKYGLEEPRCLQHWQQDYWFGLQRLQGCNPMLIRLCEQIPEKFGVTAEMVQPFLGGKTLEEALNQKKLFYVDLEILTTIKCKDDRVLCAPFALFYLNVKNEFLPIAIQLFQDKGPNNPVFLPSDDKYTWLLAKMFYNNADASYHQSLTHLGYTHLLMEGVVVCTHRNLSPSHPIFRLLAPHFLFLLAINTRGLEKLVSVGGWVDKTMTVGRDGMFGLIVEGYSRWRMDLHGLIPLELKSRKIDDPNVLPYYPYRDDALPLYEAIRKYVTKIVNHHYDSPEKIANDYELQSWRRELVIDRPKGGVGIIGVPGSDADGLTTTEQIVDILVSIMSICSVGHAAANFQQYDEYAFPPNYPGILMAEVPRDKRPRTEKEIVPYIPNKQITLDTMVITKLLSSKGTKSLGDFEVQYLYDPVALKAAKEFKEELTAISGKIKDRNANREYSYTWLDPEIIPNSISI